MLEEYEEINITKNGVSIRTRPMQILFDADGNEVKIPGKNHRSAKGVGEFETLDLYKDYINDLLVESHGEPLITLVQTRAIDAHALSVEKEEHEKTKAKLKVALDDKKIT